MIDTHCHLLPRLDDGPGTEAEAVALARQLSAEGVSRIMCTPHYSRRFPTGHLDAAERMGKLREDLDALAVSLELVLAAEVSPGFVLNSPFSELAARSIAERFVLVELEPDTPVGFLDVALERLHAGGLLPLFAHPERCRAIQRYPGTVDSARRAGCLVQVVAPSLTGRWGRDVGEAAWSLIETDRVDLLASDAHGTSRRRPRLADAARLVANRKGERVRRRLTEETPSRLLEGSHPDQAFS